MPVYTSIRVIADRPTGVDRVLHAIDVASDLFSHAQSKRTVNDKLRDTHLAWDEHIEARRITEAALCESRARRVLRFATLLAEGGALNV